MMDRVRILSICDDDGLRASRELLLLNEGYETESATSNDALSLCEAAPFDIALICRSVGSDRAADLIQTLQRSYPEMLVLAIETLDEHPESGNMGLQVASAPAILLDTIRKSSARLGTQRMV